MHVLFVSVPDATDLDTWSGTPYHMYRALLASPDVRVTLASPVRSPTAAAPFRLAERLANRLGTASYDADREPVVLSRYARLVERAIADARPDVVFSPSSVPLSAVSATVPLVVWTDATWAAMVGYYPDFSRMSARTLRLGHRAEQQALRRVSLAIYSSDWAAASARRAYGVPAGRLAVVPFGANLVDVPSRADVAARLTALDRSTCNLLLVGRDWERKGVQRAVAATGRLRDAGIDARLQVVGCEPPPGTHLPGHVTVRGRLDKADPGDAAQLAELFNSAAFFILPSLAECSPIVFAEAQAFGIPVVGVRSGGVASMMDDGHSGLLADADSFADEAAAQLSRIWAWPARYDAMAAAARNFYDNRVNWGSSVRSMLEHVRQIH